MTNLLVQRPLTNLLVCQHPPESAPEKSPVEILVDEFKVTKEEAEAAYKLNDENLDDAREYLKPQAEGEGESGNVFDFD